MQAVGLAMTESLSQAIAAWPAGNYQILLYTSQFSGSQPQDFRVLVDGAEVWRTTPADANYALQLSAPFVVAAGGHTLRIEGLDSGGGARTVLIDRVEILQF